MINMRTFETEMEVIVYQTYKEEFDEQEERFNDKLNQVIKQKTKK